MSIDVGVVIPAYNEEKYILNTIRALKSIKELSNILVVDDGSNDRTALIVKGEQVEILELPYNRGKGYALSRGLQAQQSDIILFLDADLEDSAKDAIKLVLPIIVGDADVTVAKFPFTPGKGGFGMVKKLSRAGVKALTGENFISVLSGQRAFRKEVLKPEFLNYPRFGIEFGMTIDLLNNGARICEVDVDMKHRTTKRDWNGFKHRAHQFYDISSVFIQKSISHKWRGVRH